VEQGEHCASTGLYVLLRPRRRWKDNTKTDLENVIWEAWTVLIWFRTGTGGGHF
jgi:hypothetical protein